MAHVRSRRREKASLVLGYTYVTVRRVHYVRARILVAIQILILIISRVMSQCCSIIPCDRIPAEWFCIIQHRTRLVRTPVLHQETVFSAIHRAVHLRCRKNPNVLAWCPLRRWNRRNSDFLCSNLGTQGWLQVELNGFRPFHFQFVARRASTGTRSLHER